MKVQSIHDMIKIKAEKYKNIKEMKDYEGEIEAIECFVERAMEDMIDGMLDMLDDGLIIGRREKS
jgi:hypothetical protein